MASKKSESPNKEIDKAIEGLMKDMKEADVVPETLTAKVRVIQTAIQWEKVKHHIKDDEEFDPANIV